MKLEQEAQTINGHDYMDYQIIDGIMVCELKQKVLIDMPIAIALVEARLETCDGKRYPTIFNYDNFNYAGKDVRDFMNTKGLEGMSAGAIFTNSFAVKTFFNFFLSVTKPLIPAKVFTDREKAINWLKQYTNEDGIG